MVLKTINKEGSYNVNIGGAEILSIKCISEIIGKQLNKTPLFEYQDVEAKNLIGDISKMKELHKPITSFEEAIKLMLE